MVSMKNSIYGPERVNPFAPRATPRQVKSSGLRQSKMRKWQVFAGVVAKGLKGAIHQVSQKGQFSCGLVANNLMIYT